MTKNEPKKREPKLDNMTREKIVERLRRVYERVKCKKDKTQLLDEYCGETGITRNHANVQLNGW